MANCLIQSPTAAMYTPPCTPLCVSVHTRVPVGCPGLCGGCGAAPGWGSRGSAFKSGWEPGAREAAPAEPRSQQVSAGGRGDRPEGTWGPAGRGGWRALGDQAGGMQGMWGPAGRDRGDRPCPGDAHPACQSSRSTRTTLRVGFGQCRRERGVELGGPYGSLPVGSMIPGDQSRMENMGTR